LQSTFTHSSFKTGFDYISAGNLNNRHLKNIFLSTLILMVALGAYAQRSPFSSGYTPFHEYLLQNHGDIQRQNVSSRNTVYEEIGYRHDTFSNDTAYYGDSGVFNFTPQALPVNGYYYKYGYVGQNQTWYGTGQFTDSVIGYRLLASMVMQDSVNGALVNSYEYQYAYSSSGLISQTYLTWHSGTWVDSFQYLYTYSGSSTYMPPVSIIYQTWTGSAWQNDTQYLYTYNSRGQNSQTVTQVWNGTAWVNAFRQNNNFDANGNNFQSFGYTWNGTGWSQYGLVTRAFDLNNELAFYMVQLWDSSSGYVNSYEELFAYVLGNMTQYENYSWDAVTSSWTPILQNTYSYDFFHNKTYELDATNRGGTFVGTDEYYYYYASYTVSGVNEVRNDLNATLYPNPAIENEINVSLNAVHNEVISTFIWDEQGKLISNSVKQASAGTNIFNIDLHGMAAGVYFLQLTGPQSDKSSVLKFVKQ
jgi:hypothetical protein